MESREFYSKIDEYIKTIKKEEIIDFVNNIIRKIPECKFEEVLCIINKNASNINEIEIKKKIEEYKKKFMEIEEGKLCFYAEQYEDYSYGWDNWKVEYTDKDNLGEFITDSVKYAIKLVNYKEYRYAKEIFDMIIDTNYQAFDEDAEENFEISLVDLKENELISVNISTLCLYIIYVTYQISSNKVKDIYNYFKNNQNFINISIEDSFKLGIEQLTNLEDFFAEWINFLAQTKGDIEYHLLKEALIYTDYIGYERYLSEITKNHPKLYIDIFNHLEKENKINELVNLGKEVLRSINNKSRTGSDIALYLASVDIKNKEKYICEAFMFDANILNLLRIINNGYYNKIENDIRNKIKIVYVSEKNNEETSVIDKEDYYLLQFFSGNFEEFYNESIKHKNLLGWTNSFEKKSVFLWLLLLNETDQKTKSYSKIISNIFSDIGYNENNKQFLDDNIDEIWKKWKCNFKLDENIKVKVIKWLNIIIEKRVEAIMDGNYRKAYYKAALLIVAYGEMMLSQNLGTKEEYIKYYMNKYSRRSAFKSELNELL